jgi:hypothetical protein
LRRFLNTIFKYESKGIKSRATAIIREVISKMQITFKDKARADEKAEHTLEYVSILRRSATL